MQVDAAEQLNKEELGSMSRVYNFNAGPAMLPDPVMRQAQSEFLNWQGTGASVMELSHRSEEFKQIAEEATQNLRDILNIPNHYHILFLQGGGRSQFAMVPMNLLDRYHSAAYVQTGLWGQLAINEAKRYCDVQVIADSEASAFTTIPNQSQWLDPKEAAYLHYVDNETINGVEFNKKPDDYGLPLVCDMSSNILSKVFDVSRYGLIYACAQKNMGPSGVTVVIIRDDLLQRQALEATPSMFRYQLHAEKKSMYNTSPTYPWYIAGLVYQWVKAEGGVAALEARNQRKAKKLYDYIDQSGFYTNPVDVNCRSRMNVIFTLPEKAQESLFLEQSLDAGLMGLKGHRFLGGMRASIYNAMPEAGVDALIAFMQDFMRRYG